VQENKRAVGISNKEVFMRTAGLNKIIDEFSHLPLEDKEYAIDVITKQLIEAKRDAIARRAKQADANLKKGQVKKGSLKALYEDLEND
jgi:adenine C2-methylase RlmN of 23S rRNA A2503 and tRNA A37